MPNASLTRRLTDAGKVGEDGIAELRKDAERRERQTEWVAGRNAKLAKRRESRRERLKSGTAGYSDLVASTAWSWLAEPEALPKPMPASIAVLNRYVARDDQGAADALEELQLGGLPTSQPPPMSVLATDAGRSLRLHLTMLAVANLTITDGAKMINRPGHGSSTDATAKDGLQVAASDKNKADWAKLLGITAGGKARTTRTHEPLRRLEELGFLIYPTGHPSKFTLLSEDGTKRHWIHPNLDPVERSFTMPLAFWTNRWYLWLTPAEIATLFTIYHGWDNGPAKVRIEGLGLPESVRRSVYDMSGERYSTVHELVEFGLVEMASPSLRPKKAQAPGRDDLPGLTHHFAPRPHGLEGDARKKILACLDANALPPRLAELPAKRAFYAAELRDAAATRAAPAGPGEPRTP